MPFLYKNVCFCQLSYHILFCSSVYKIRITLHISIKCYYSQWAGRVTKQDTLELSTLCYVILNHVTYDSNSNL